MLARAVEASLKTNILVDTETLCAKTGPLWPNLVRKPSAHVTQFGLTIFLTADRVSLSLPPRSRLHAV